MTASRFPHEPPEEPGIDWERELRTFPDRHSRTVKYLLWLLFNKATKAPVMPVLEVILPRIGFERIRTEVEICEGAWLVTDNWVESPEIRVDL